MSPFLASFLIPGTDIHTITRTLQKWTKTNHKAKPSDASQGSVRSIKFHCSNGPSKVVLQLHEMAWNHGLNQYVSLLSRIFHLPLPIFRIFLACATIWRPVSFGVLLLSLCSLSFHFLTYIISIDQSAPGGCTFILSRHYTRIHIIDSYVLPIRLVSDVPLPRQHPLETHSIICSRHPLRVN